MFLFMGKNQFGKRVLVLVFTLCAFYFSAAQRFVTVNGKDIVDPNGNKILLKGINLGNWLVPEGYFFKFGDVNSPDLIDRGFKEMIGEEETKKFWNQYLDTYITQEDIAYIKKSGFNHVRIPFHYKLFTSDDYLNGENKGFVYLDRLIEWCSKEGLWVLLDMHCAPGGQTGDNIDDSYGYPFLLESIWAQDLTVSIWRKIAERYKNNPTVLGYDLLNEPIAHYFSSNENLNKSLEPLYKRITKAVREVDAKHLIFYGGAQWNTNFGVFGEPFDMKAVYTFHKYWMPVNQGEIQAYLDFSTKYNVPLYLGESGENTDQWIKSFRELLEKHQVSWCFWPYKKMNSPKCMVSIKQPDDFHYLIEYLTSDRSRYSNIRSHRPDASKVKKAMSDYLLNLSLNQCIINTGYLEALIDKEK